MNVLRIWLISLLVYLLSSITVVLFQDKLVVSILSFWHQGFPLVLQLLINKWRMLLMLLKIWVLCLFHNKYYNPHFILMKPPWGLAIAGG
ncbi:hypothetical protein [Sickelvirus maringis]|uniref:Uncharacterized protein n=1 Tax=Circoviridae sp. TaxID=1954248 RepID=A0ABY4CL76_9VIRU|nr:hypothetical protein [Circoviridae sp.]